MRVRSMLAKSDSMRYRFADWVVHNWSRAGMLVAVLLLAIAPIIYHSSGRAVFLIYLWLPLYMLHHRRL